MRRTFLGGPSAHMVSVLLKRHEQNDDKTDNSDGNETGLPPYAPQRPGFVQESWSDEWIFNDGMEHDVYLTSAVNPNWDGETDLAEELFILMVDGSEVIVEKIDDPTLKIAVWEAKIKHVKLEELEGWRGVVPAHYEDENGAWRDPSVD